MLALVSIPLRRMVAALFPAVFLRVLPASLTVLTTALLTACAGMPPGETGIMLETAARGQPIAGATCAATVGSMRWEVTTPAVLPVGNARGELHIVCDKAGFRTSELIFRAGSGATSPAGAGFGTGGYGSSAGLSLSFPLGGASAPYPKRLVIDLNPA